MTTTAADRDLGCQEFVTLITAYLDGALPAGTAALVEAHLAECPGCDEYLAQMRLTISALGHVPLRALSPQARNGILAAFQTFPRET